MPEQFQAAHPGLSSSGPRTLSIWHDPGLSSSGPRTLVLGQVGMSHDCPDRLCVFGDHTARSLDRASSTFCLTSMAQEMMQNRAPFVSLSTPAHPRACQHLSRGQMRAPHKRESKADAGDTWVLKAKTTWTKPGPAACARREASCPSPPRKFCEGWLKLLPGGCCVPSRIDIHQDWCVRWGPSQCG